MEMLPLLRNRTIPPAAMGVEQPLDVRRLLLPENPGTKLKFQAETLIRGPCPNSRDR
jgi:hypothetical protein